MVADGIGENYTCRSRDVITAATEVTWVVYILIRWFLGESELRTLLR